MNAKELINSHLEEFLSSRGVNTNKQKFECLICGSSDGANFVPNTNKTKVKCFSANHQGKSTCNIIDYYMQLESVDFKTAINTLKDIYNITDNNFQYLKNNSFRSDEQSEEEKRFIENEIIKDIEISKNTVGANDYLINRGISLDVQKRYNIGFISNWVHPKIKCKYQQFKTSPRIIIPTSLNSYLARATRHQDEGKDGKYKALKVGNVHIFNDTALTNSCGYCYIFEGEIDCLSAIELNYNAVGIGSTSMIDKFFTEYYINRDNILIIALDNDQGGNTATQKIINLCVKNKIPYYVANTEMLFNGAKDCNQALQENRELLKHNLEQCKNQALHIDKSPFINNGVGGKVSSGMSALLTAEDPTPNTNNHTPVPKWYNQLKFSPKGFILPSLHNVVTILRNDDTYKDKIEFNELKTERELNHDKWTDKVESKLKLYLEEEYGVSISIENINHACNNVEKNYHPIKDYLNSLQWDGISRVDTAFINFLGAKDNAYVRKVSAITFLGAIARLYNAGCKYDTCTTFVGRQGIGKSKFIRKLAINYSWFTDDISSFDGNQLYEKIKGKWLIELGEGTAFQKSIKERTKQVITQQEDTYRTPYARHPEERKRQCIFLGTTNNYDFLKDETGDRRFYPIDCDIRNAKLSIDDDLTSDYVNQLWAEALQRWKNHEEIYITDRNILAIAEQEQRNHFDESPLQADIYNFLEILLPSPQDWYSMELESRRRYIRAVQNGEDTSKSLGRVGIYKRDRVSVKEIMCELFGYELNQTIERKLSLEVARSLTALGWNKLGQSLRIQPYGKQKIYMR